MAAGCFIVVNTKILNGFEFFENIYYINLASRPDRDLATRYELERLGIKATRVEAVSGENKFLAFNESQYKALFYSDGDPVLILEDDIRFRISAVTDCHLSAAVKELPADWDMLYLGANITGSDVTNWNKPEPYSPHLSRLTNAWTTHAVAYSRKCINDIIGTWDWRELPIYDEWLRVNILPVKKCFVINPMIADQRPGYSDIWRGQVEYGFFEEGNKRMGV